MSLISKGKKIVTTISPNLYAKCSNFKQSHIRKNIEMILRRREERHFYDSDKIFNRLQSAYLPLPEYGFDAYSAWRRGAERILELLKYFESLRKSGLKILEAGCGDGMTACLLKSYGHQLTLTDQEDWRDSRARDVQFIKIDLTNTLPLDSNSFDFVYSYNTFEHLYDPKKALSELIRVCKKEGYIYLEFGPLYASPWGLHAFETLRIPYPQYLFSKSFLEAKLNELGIYDLGKKMSTLQPLNQWRVNQYDNLWEDSNCSIVSKSRYADTSHLGLIEKFPDSFKGLNLTFDDVTVQALYITLRKR